MSYVRIFPSSPVVTFNLRTQFTFTVANPTLNCILNRIVLRPGVSVNITGFEQTRIVNSTGVTCVPGCNLVRMVVGTAQMEVPAQNAKVIEILQNLGITFQINLVIQLLNLPVGQPGIFRTLYSALICRPEFDVQGMYFGEPIVNAFGQINLPHFIDVRGDINAAIQILVNAEANQCPITACGPIDGANCSFC